MASRASGGAQGSDLRKVEQPFGVGLGLPHPAAQLGQTGADHGDRELLLGAAVKRGNQCRHLWFLNVLKLVDKDDDRCCCRPRCDSDLFEQRRQIPFEIAIVSQAWLRIVIEAHFNIGVGQIQVLFRSEGRCCTDRIDDRRLV